MKAIATSTDRGQRVNGKLCRVWEATSEAGIRFTMYVLQLRGANDRGGVRASIESTPRIEILDGEPGRIWTGSAPMSVTLHVLRVQVLDTERQDEFERDLVLATRPPELPDRPPQSWSTRLVL